MPEENTVYRAFPPKIDSPSRATTLSEVEFKTLKEPLINSLPRIL